MIGVIDVGDTVGDGFTVVAAVVAVAASADDTSGSGAAGPLGLAGSSDAAWSCRAGAQLTPTAKAK